ncbi:MAG: hypothetical protein LDLANPLL_01055 [Turneriella sp.]|nr:hypothetical protein [Turneriella sp.]
MQIKLKNCNNIQEGILNIETNQLNIKYGINGTGKSTIAKAIEAYINDTQGNGNSLQTLKPFKSFSDAASIPEVIGAETFKTVRVFNEEYVNEFVFQPDELVKGSFDIFIRNAEYDAGIIEVDRHVQIIKDMLSQEKDIDDLINDFNELNSSFGKSAKTGIHGSSIISKAFKNGNKVANIPPNLQGFTPYITHSENYKWIKWQIDGKSYLDIAASCPYCVSDITKSKEKIVELSQAYDPKSVENLNKVISVFQRLDKYFSDQTKKTIDGFIKNIDGYTDDQANFLREVRDQVDRLHLKFINAKSLGFVSLKDVEKVIESLNSHKITLELFNHLNSEETEKKVKIINDSIEAILQKANELQGKINIQKKLIQRLVKEYKEEINGFLKNAGYNYSVTLVSQANGQYLLKLIHNDLSDEISDVKSHLSFGERNAFSLVLFMYDALKAKPDLIILDDPISSFDKNKKFAIIDMLFRREKNFRDKTVLMLTHDFEPIVDMIYHHQKRFSVPNATFIENIRGKLTEKKIERRDISTYLQICTENIGLAGNMISKLVYLRRKFEIDHDHGLGFQFLSSLFHKRITPDFRENGTERPLTADEIRQAESLVQAQITGFEYNKVMQLVQDDNQMCQLYTDSTSNYEKLHIYRIIFEGKPGAEEKVIEKFINESFHIENDYIYQLNPREFQLVPQYVIDACDARIKAL